MAIITAHTIFSDSINVAVATEELRDSTTLKEEFNKEYRTYAFSNYESFELELNILMSKLEADIGYLSSIYKKTLVENLLKTKEQVEEVILQLEAAIIMIDGNITERKAQLSHIEKFRAYVAEEEAIAKKRNIDFGMLISYARTTAGYLSYVLTVAPEQLENVDPTSPLTRFKEAKQLLEDALIGYGFGGLTGSTVLDPLEALVATMDTSLSVQPIPTVVPDVVITQDDFETQSIQDSVIAFKPLLENANLAALTLPVELTEFYFTTFGIDNSQRGKAKLSVESFQQKMRKALIELMLSGREEIKKEAIGEEAKLQGYINKIAQKRNELALKENQLEEVNVKITASGEDVRARVATVQNFYDNLLRQGTEITGSYANSVVSSVPTNASGVIEDFKDFLDMEKKEIDVRI